MNIIKAMALMLGCFGIGILALTGCVKRAPQTNTAPVKGNMLYESAKYGYYPETPT